MSWKNNANLKKILSVLLIVIFVVGCFEITSVDINDPLVPLGGDLNVEEYVNETEAITDEADIDGNNVQGEHTENTNSIESQNDINVEAETQNNFQDIDINSENSQEVVESNKEGNVDEMQSASCEHKWSYLKNNDGTHLSVCEKCGEKKVETCDIRDDEKCSLCGYILPCNHNWMYESKYDGTHQKQCKECETLEIENCSFDDNGRCIYCGFCEKINSFENLEELKKYTKLNANDVVTTMGYYEESDGGGGTYTVVKSTKYRIDNGRCVALDNGLFAILNSESRVSVRQYGVVGDGRRSDFNQLQNALRSGYPEIYFPKGVYDCNKSIIMLDNYISIIGDDKSQTIVKNLGLGVKYGISISNITFDGGAQFGIMDAGGINYNADAIIVIYPKNKTSNIRYDNCSFMNTDFASAVNSTGNIASDNISNCNFTNINRVAIYHSINIGQSRYSNNSFKNIGGINIKSGPVSAIWIGDVTNCTKVESQQVYIENNIFEDLYTADDTTGSHIINANFIAVKARRATINNNTITGVHGYGEDREALYTKVTYLTVTNNYITNGGFGEGYITCKGQDGLEAFATITNNTIVGDYGAGIYNYGAAQIKNNVINIANCKAAIVCYPRDCDTNKKLSVSLNNINANPGSYSINGKNMNNTSNYLVRIEAIKSEIFVQSNNITTVGDVGSLKGVIRIGSLKNNVTLTDNRIKCEIPDCIGIMINGNTDTSQDNKNVTILAASNQIITSNFGIQVILKNDSNVKSNRYYMFKSNKVSGVKSTKYGIYVDGGINNDDVLEYSKAKGDNVSFNKVYANVSKVENEKALVVLKTK